MDVAELLAKQEIIELLYRYCRGVDRLDMALVRSCYHPDATDSHGTFSGPVDEYLAWSERLLRRYDATLHTLTNILIEVDLAAGQARSEAYGVAYHRTEDGAPELNLTVGFRFIDDMETRGGGPWRIARRVATTEWVREERYRPGDPRFLSGSRDRSDPVYAPMGHQHGGVLRSADMQTENVELSTADGPMRLYMARPDATPSAAVIVIQEAFGVNGHIEDVTRRVAEEGYLTVAPDLFHRYETNVAGYDDMEMIFEMMGNLTDTQILMDVDAALAHLAGEGFAPGQVGITGFCMGGRVTFLTVISRPMGAGVSWYGGAIVTEGFTPAQPKLADRHGDLQAPWLGLFGDLDGMIPVEGVEQLRTDLADNPHPTEIVRYADADHGFYCDERPSYQAEAAADGWSRMKAWFATHLP